jgi:N,N'-diacetyllegionaminate synthase
MIGGKTVWQQFRHSFRIGDRKMGPDAPCFIIAEAGVSHMGDLSRALELVDAAVVAGADAIKFQAFRVQDMISSVCTEWVERMRPKELPISAMARIKEECDRRGIIFFSSAHDEASLLALSKLDVPCFKIGSGEVQNLRYYRLVGGLGRPVIASTGMYSWADVELMLRTLADAGCTELALMHCVTQYPTPPADVNLRVIETLRKAFSGPVGYSDHSATYDIPAASVLLGAQLIERHLTLEKNIPNTQDWKVACSPSELVEFVASVRRLETALGDGQFRITQGEEESLKWARKSVVAARDIPVGEIIREADLVIKRPGTGISPLHLDRVVGRRARLAIAQDMIVVEEMLE